MLIHSLSSLSSSHHSSLPPLSTMASGRSHFKETFINCFGVLKSSPPLLSVLIYTSFYLSFMICLFALVGFSMGAQTLSLLLMAGLQTAIAVPGYLYMMWNEPKYILIFALVQLATFLTEGIWMTVMFSETGFSGKTALLMVLTILQLSNVIVSFFFRDLRVDFCCCGKNRRASGLNSVSLENGLTPPPANWAKTKQAPSLSTSEKVTIEKEKKEKTLRKSTIKNALRRKKNSVDFDVEKQPKKGTVHSPLEKNIFGGISEEEKERAMRKRLSRMPVSTPSRSMTKSPKEVRVVPGSSFSSRSVDSGLKVVSKKSPIPNMKGDTTSGSKDGSGSKERATPESINFFSAQGFRHAQVNE